MASICNFLWSCSNFVTIWSPYFTNATLSLLNKWLIDTFLLDAAESDVLRVFDPNFMMTNKQLMEVLAKANLTAYGFEMTKEMAIETDGNGEEIVKKTIHYMVTDACSKDKFWLDILKERIPGLDSNGLKLGKTLVREVKSRINDRGTKYCNIGLEIHLNRCPRRPVTPVNRLTKRSPQSGCGLLCLFCFTAKIAYELD